MLCVQESWLKSHVDEVVANGSTFGQAGQAALDSIREKYGQDVPTNITHVNKIFVNAKHDATVAAAANAGVLTWAEASASYEARIDASGDVDLRDPAWELLNRSLTHYSDENVVPRVSKVVANKAKSMHRKLSMKLNAK